MRIITGDCMEELQALEPESVHSCMTSPPYWNLRDYGHDDQLGLEADSDDYVQNIADVMDEVKRVLRPDGSLWLNLGDTYDDKNLQQIPARVALELQQRGWILRNRVTWAKPNPMPQSVKDRLNDTTEAVFHFVPNREYWYDLDAIREPFSEMTERINRFEETVGQKRSNQNAPGNHDQSNGLHSGGKKYEKLHPAGKNPGDVFEVTTKPFPDAHFAVYPPELCAKPIKATAAPQVCVECGAPYEREIERETLTPDEIKTHFPDRCADVSSDRNDGYRHQINHDEREDLRNKLDKATHAKGWRQTCDCDTDATEAGIILDPFAGAGTTLLKAKELGRDAIGIELNPEYADMARARIGLEPHNPANVREDKEQNGLEDFS